MCCGHVVRRRCNLSIGEEGLVGCGWLLRIAMSDKHGQPMQPVMQRG